jgi:hypothetical protein
MLIALSESFKFFVNNSTQQETEMLDKEQLLAMGKDAPLGDDLLRAFPAGNLASFARKELFGIMENLKVKTIGELAAKTKSEIHGPQCRFAGNKTLSWIESVCCEFGITPPQYGESPSLSQQEALEFLRGLRPISGTDPDFDYEKGEPKV